MSASHRREGPSRRVVCALGLLVALPGRPLHAEGASASDWVVGEHARTRLIDAGPWPGDARRRLAGIEIELDPGYLTYWRSPGEAGVPPTLDTAGSVNLQSATLLFPSPGLYSEDGTQAFGYKDHVLFPLLVELAEAGRPVDLHANLSFATCERQCLSAQAAMRLPLAADGPTPEASLVQAALARVPAERRLGEAGPLAITAVRGQAGDDTLTVLAHTDGTDVPTLFAEAADPWFAQAGAGLWLNDGSLSYAVKILSKPADAAPLPLRLTLVGADHAITVAVTLDAPPPKP